MSLNIDGLIRNVKSIIDNLRCGLCDKLNGVRVRFGCGHTCCGDCVATSGSCLLCLTPPGQPHIEPAVDQQLTEHVRNAEALLDTFQTLFHVDVNRYLRLSEQLKVEKEVFPECIQAEIKYSNPNRTLSFYQHKENFDISKESDQYIGSCIKMDKSNFVKQWLHKHNFNTDKTERKPFSDLNVNSPQLSRGKSLDNVMKTRASMILDKLKVDVDSRKKRAHFKTTNKRGTLKKKSTSKHDNYLSKLTSKQDEKDENYRHRMLNSYAQDESGIEVDVSGTEVDMSVIEQNVDSIVKYDPQYKVVDKDKLALLAVEEADRNQSKSESISILETAETNTHVKKDIDNTIMKVPFFKRSALYEFCKGCSYGHTPQKDLEIPFKPVSITIENESFKTTVNIYHNQRNQFNHTHKSISIQTDETKPWDIVEGSYKKYGKLLTKSQDLFTNDDKIYSEVACDEVKSLTQLKKLPNLQKDDIVVLDSDSDKNYGASIEVTADVHRSCEDVDYGVLTEIHPSESGYRRRPRGLTPISTDSSDKENCDPNRPKKPRMGKKKLKK